MTIYQTSNSHQLSQPSASFAYINTIVDTANSLGVDKNQLLQSVGLSLEQLSEPNARTPMTTLMALLTNGARFSNNEDFGLHVGPHIKACSFGLMGYLSMCSKNMRETAELMLKYRRVAFDAGETHLQEHGPDTALAWTPHKAQYLQNRYLVDAIISGWSCFSRLSCGDDLLSSRIDLSYPQPKSTAVHRQLLSGEVYFGQQQNRMYIPTRLIDKPQIHANAEIFDSLNKQAYAYVQELNAQESVLDEVRHSLCRLLPKGDGNIDSVAQALHMNRRTLQRKLRAKATNFKQLSNELREDLAQQYLKDQNLSMLDIALLLGFSDNSAFTTAFKGWKSMTPSEYRQHIPQRP